MTWLYTSPQQIPIAVISIRSPIFRTKLLELFYDVFYVSVLLNAIRMASF